MNGQGGGESFRADVAAWLDANFPRSLAFKSPQPYLTDAAYADADPDFGLWLRNIVDRGWGAPTWPVQYGGGGLSEGEARILAEEMARVGAFQPNRTYGQMMLGPTLLEFGNEDQKQRFVPPIARGEVRWCQGFSEPGAGSDLASLQTRCEDKGDHWLVNGQKIWTSGANHADWCFALVRTDTSRKQGGISFLLIDMRSPGVDARPIELISGSTHFCEVFFTDVAVPKENMIGGVNQGWGIAKRLLQFERDSLATGRVDAPSLAEFAKRYLGVDDHGRIADPVLRQRIVGNAIRNRAYTHYVNRSAAAAKAENGVSAAVSVLKNLGAAISQERAELVVDILGNQGLGWDGDGFSAEELEATRAWLHSRAFSIYGGSFEIQNNITAKRVLGLPSR
ncbi:MAG: acyl-CoA dehydrogenase family protein [Sphingobium sp.]